MILFMSFSYYSHNKEHYILPFLPLSRSLYKTAVFSILHSTQHCSSEAKEYYTKIRDIAVVAKHCNGCKDCRCFRTGASVPRKSNFSRCFSFSFVSPLSICHRIGEDCAEYKFNYTHYDFMAVLRACT
jgi:hypothetical protein